MISKRQIVSFEPSLTESPHWLTTYWVCTWLDTQLSTVKSLHLLYLCQIYVGDGILMLNKLKTDFQCIPEHPGCVSLFWSWLCSRLLYFCVRTVASFWAISSVWNRPRTQGRRDSLMALPFPNTMDYRHYSVHQWGKNSYVEKLSRGYTSMWNITKLEAGAESQQEMKTMIRGSKLQFLRVSKSTILV